MTVNNLLNSDKSVSKKEEDRFQRYSFAKRIAETISKNKSSDCIVMGIYGAWGEGKTSLMDFIESELQNQNGETIIRIKFNPWRYPNETSLLFNFFCIIAKSLGIDLLNKKEKTGQWITKNLGSIHCKIPKVGEIGKVASTIGTLLFQAELEELKKRLGTNLKETNKKIVIFIDDIDRLDKDEIHAVFRLVKLTADFPNTTYILAFDPKVVSSVLSERYAAGDSESGQSFLEKIIQVPLSLPKAQTQALRKYCFELIENAFNNNNIELPQKEAQRFVNEFTPSLLSQFKTPRMIVRYGNALSFSLPLLHNEANLVDLMLIEGIKTIFPNIYQFIRENPMYFIGGFNTTTETLHIEERKEFIKKAINEQLNQIEEHSRESILILLKELFPYLKEIYNKLSPLSDRTIDKLIENKNIGSTKYFNRYFTYCVIDGELSDISFNEFQNDLSHMSEDDLKEAIQTLINQSNPKEFIYSLRNIENKLNWNDYFNLSKVLSQISLTFPEDRQNFFLKSQSARGQLISFLSKRLRNCEQDQSIFNVVTDIIINSDSLDFILDFFHSIMSQDSSGNIIMTSSQRKRITNTLVKRVLEEAKDTPVFELYHSKAKVLFHYWNEYNRNKLRKYIEKILSKHPKKSVNLVKVYLNKFTSLEDNRIRIDKMNQNNYESLATVFDPNFIYQIILKAYSEKQLNGQEDIWEETEDDQPADINIARQFVHWHTKAIEAEKIEKALL